MARNLKDANLLKTFALPAAASTSTQSAVIDLGADTFKPEGVEAILSVPALTVTMAPDTRTATYIIETSTTSVFTAVDQTILSEVFTGAGGDGIRAAVSRCRLPSDCARYIRAKITFGASMVDSSTVTATFSLGF